MITENLSTLKIHKLTQKQYDRALAAGNIDENALYLTPDEPLAYTEYVTILPETTLTFEETTEDVATTEICLPQYLDLKAGTIYLVNWDGTEYKCQCVESSNTINVFTTLGNESYASDALEDIVDGEPFYIMNISGNAITGVITTVSGNHTLSIAEEVVHKVDQKYLPEYPAYTEHVPVLPETTLTFTGEVHEYGDGNTEVDIENGITVSSSLNLVAGATYLVNWNGTEYKCTTSNGTFLGNTSLQGITAEEADDGEPFLFAVSPLGAYIVYTGAIGEYTFSITEEVVHKLDEKYLPDVENATFVSYGKSQTLTEEQKSKARENIGAASTIETNYVTPEMYGAVGDGVTDDTQAFIDAINSGSKVVCNSNATYYFQNPVDVRTLTRGYLDGNNAHFINFHIYININDEFNSWRHAYNAGRFIIENMRLGKDWGVLPEGWETPSIVTGAPCIIKNIYTRSPYLLATPDVYIDYMTVDSCGFSNDWSIFEEHGVNLDGISCLNQNGEYCRFNINDTPNSSGDTWLITRCTEFGKENSDYRFMRLVKRNGTKIQSCIQTTFDVGTYSVTSFDSCHWEDKGSVTFSSNALCETIFTNCYFYDNHVINNDESTTYQNCFIRATYDSAHGGVTLANVLDNVSPYDLQCKMINCCVGANYVIDSNYLKNNKYMSKKTYIPKNTHGHRRKLAETDFNMISGYRNGMFFDSTGVYTYDIYLKATSLSNVAIDYATKEVNIENIKDALYMKIQFVKGGFSMIVYRTSPDGKLCKTEFYGDINAQSGEDYLSFDMHEYGSYVEFMMPQANCNPIATPWIEVNEKEEFIIDEALYEANGVLVTSDGSKVTYDTDGLIQMPNGTGATNVDVDYELNSNSANPIANKAVYSKFQDIENNRLIYITPEMFGAVGDGVTDDTQAIQNAIDSGGTVYFKSPQYLITGTININNKRNYNLYANDTIITYTGTGYAFNCNGIRNCNLHFNTIIANNGSAIKLSDENDICQYNNIYGNNFQFSDIGVCISANSVICNNTISGMRLLQGNIGIKVENMGGIVNGTYIDSVQYESLQTGIDIYNDGGSMVIFTIKKMLPANVPVLIKTVGNVMQLEADVLRSYVANEYDLSDETDGRITGQSNLIIRNGLIIPNIVGTTNEILNIGNSDTGIRDLRDMDTVYHYYTIFINRGNVTKLYLSEIYGIANGINRFILRNNEDAGDDFTIYDANENAIYTAGAGWSDFEFIWFPGIGWSVYKLTKA